MTIESLHSLILQNIENKSILTFLGLESSTSQQLTKWPDGTYQPEGSNIYFEEYGDLLPDSVKYALFGHNIMVNEISGEIFSAHIGRFTFIVKGNFEQLHEGIRIGNTLDDYVDVTELGNQWALLSNLGFEEEEFELKKSYKYTKDKLKNYNQTLH